MNTVYRLAAGDPKCIHVRGASRQNDVVDIAVRPGMPESILYGPYFPLKAGRYTGVYHFDERVRPQGSFVLDVQCDDPRQLIAEVHVAAEDVLAGGFKAYIDFDLPRDTFDFEIRLRACDFTARLLEVVILEHPQDNRQTTDRKPQHNDHRFRAPVDLQRTASPVKRILVIGSCMSQGAILSAPSSFSPLETVVDHILFNFVGEVPERPQAPIEDYAFQVVMLPLRTVMPETAFGNVSYTDLPAWNSLMADCERRLIQLLESALSYNHRFGLTTFIANFLVPQQNSIGRLLPQSDARNPVYFVRRLNDLLAEYAADRKNAYVLDLDGIAASIGKRRIQDDAITYNSHGTPNAGWGHDLDMARLQPPPAMEKAYELSVAEFYRALWNEVAAMNRTLRQQDSIKIVICDLDDTLWRGILAEEDMEGENRLGGWPLGLIEALTILKKRGVLLAICSKNNDELIQRRWVEVIGNRLPLSSFVSVKINWDPKADNIASILRETNLLARNALFIDDNPVERAAVEAAHPDIRTLGADLYYIRRILLWAPELQSSDVTQESARRTEMIQSQVAREKTREAMPRSEFLATLNLEIRRATIGTIQHPLFKRAFELVNKSNQFNTTGKRWTTEEFGRFFSDGGGVDIFHAQDKFTDYGWVCVVIRKDNQIHQFVMSCRVVGLDVEVGVLNVIGREMSMRHGEIVAMLTETDANFLCRELYSKNGFKSVGQTWIATSDSLPRFPTHIKFETVDADAA